MKTRLLFSIAAAFFLIFLSSHDGVAQTVTDSTAIYRIELLDGNEFIGTIVSQNADTIRLKTQNLGILSILKKDIKAMSIYDQSKMKNGALWFDNPQATRYLFAPNAYGLKPGEGYYQNVWIFVNQVSVGITENFSLGAGTVPLFLFGGGGYTPVWLLPKVSIPVVKDRFNVGGGALIGTVLGEEDASFGIAYGLSTIGTRDKNMTLGVGYGYAAGEWANKPTITLSGLLRTGSRGYLITENYYISVGDESIGLIGLGGRRIIKNFGLDFGLIFPIGADNDFVAAPFLGFSVPFGKKARVPVNR